MYFLTFCQWVGPGLGYEAWCLQSRLIGKFVMKFSECMVRRLTGREKLVDEEICVSIRSVVWRGVSRP
jgi:hypothetical protein